MKLLRLLFPMWYTFNDINRSEEDEMKENTIALAQELKAEELKGNIINTPQKIQEFVNKKNEHI